jgi:hypothetical protein
VGVPWVPLSAPLAPEKLWKGDNEMKRMFLAAVENESRDLVKYLAFQPGMGWYLTFDESSAYTFPRAGQRRVAELWQSERSKFASEWSSKVAYIELDR